MSKIFRWIVESLLLGLLSGLLRLRYRIELVNAEVLDRLSAQKGVLFLPNHPAEIDPVILQSLLWRRFSPRPVVDENFYHLPVLSGLMRFMAAIALPDIHKTAGVLSKFRTRKAFDQMASALSARESVLMYPAGKLMRRGIEQLGGASGVEQLLGYESLDFHVVAIRTRGLWGSSFSPAVHGGMTPSLGATLAHALGALLKNGFFFLPRRRVCIELKDLGEELRRQGDRSEINRSLEAFYNAKGEESLSRVSYSAFRDCPLPEVETLVSSAPDLSDVDKGNIEGFLLAFADAFAFEAGSLSERTHLADDLSIDSLLKSEILIWLAEEYGAHELDMSDVHVLGDLIRAVYAPKESAENAEVTTQDPRWSEDARPSPMLPSEAHLGICFLSKCDEMKSCIAQADEGLGVLSWRQLKRAVLAFSLSFKSIEDSHVGVMLPAGSGANVVAMGLILSGKVPVMLNWTLGEAHLGHAIEASGVKRVITSARFLDKAHMQLSDDFLDHLLFLEDWKREAIGFGIKIKVLLGARLKASFWISSLGLRSVDPDSPAVILFTSGSEAKPKGVPLSHRHILANLRAGLNVLALDSSTILYGFLPPFHSFGFTVTSMAPMVAGIKAFYSPNPTESRKIASCCEQWAVNVLFATPTFAANIFKSAQAGQLDGLKLVITGAERQRQDVIAFVEALPDAVLIEGYGITECAPIISVKAPEMEGVGRPLPGVELLIVDLDSRTPLASGEQGLILVRGPNVFSGYLGGSPDPFVEVDGKSWYNTGDLGSLNAKGELLLSGRLKRFVKMGGEMISLPAIEAALQDYFPESEEGPILAVEAIGVEGEAQELVLFSTIDADLKQINRWLMDQGMSSLCRLKRLVQLEEIPLLGTGKTNYWALKHQGAS